MKRTPIGKFKFHTDTFNNLFKAKKVVKFRSIKDFDDINIKDYPYLYIFATKETKLLKGSTGNAGCGQFDIPKNEYAKLEREVKEAVGKKVSFRWGDPVAITGVLRAAYRKRKLWRTSSQMDFLWIEIELRDGTIILASLYVVHPHSFRVRGK